MTTIEEAKRNISEMEVTLLSLLGKLEDAYGIAVRDIEIDRIDTSTYDKRSSKIGAVRLRCELRGEQ